jgi:Immunity protein 27
MKLAPHETTLVGRWFAESGQLRAGATCARINWLTSHHLRQIGISEQWGAWETLFQDPDDGRYWERTYPHGEMQGGGPPALSLLTREQAKAKYGDAVP